MTEATGPAPGDMVFRISPHMVGFIFSVDAITGWDGSSCFERYGVLWSGTLDTVKLCSCQFLTASQLERR